MNHRLATLEITSPGRWPSFLAALAIACLPLLAHETRAHGFAPPPAPPQLLVAHRLRLDFVAPQATMLGTLDTQINSRGGLLLPTR
jgi:hypothetical protein